MDKNNIFDNLFIFDMANNHQGDLEHGKNIIRSISKVSKEENCRGAIKFQYRQLDSFIHPDYKDAKSPKHIQRFLSTQLKNDEYKILVDEVKKSGLLTMCTPFDEESVGIIEEHNIDIIKVASCSAQDWPLLERIADAGKPVVCSTGGCVISEIDKIVSFFKHRSIQLAIMHCIAIYPTAMEDLQLNYIDFLKKRYPFLPIGLSSHENPDNRCAVQLAIAKGAMLLERHVGVETEEMTLNAYSSNPEQIAGWLDAANIAIKACGSKGMLVSRESEIESLNSLKRGVYARKDIKAGEVVAREDVLFAMPYQEGNMNSGEFPAKFIAKRRYIQYQPIPADEIDHLGLKQEIYSAIHEAKGLLYQARVAIGREFTVVLSHHYGIERFKKDGAIIIDCVNREYCKKIIIQIAGQHHPTHYHKVKEETFQILWGELILVLDGKQKSLYPGDQVIVKRGQQHSFTTKYGVIFEEISTTNIKNDSFYEDKNIYVDSNLRKTSLADSLHTFEQYKFIYE